MGREKRNAGSIFALNLFLGWTFVGWVVAFVWAWSQDATAVRTVVQARPEDATDKLLKLKKLLDDGAINQDEYDTQKSKILNA